MSVTSMETSFSEKEKTKNKIHPPRKPPVKINIVVRRVGLEPTKACARGS